MIRSTPTPKFLTVKDAAKILKLSRSKVYQLVEQRKIVSHKIGGSVRIAEADLNEFIASCRIEIKCGEKRQKRSRHKLRHLNRD